MLLLLLLLPELLAFLFAIAFQVDALFPIVLFGYRRFGEVAVCRVGAVLAVPSCSELVFGWLGAHIGALLNFLRGKHPNVGVGAHEVEDGGVGQALGIQQSALLVGFQDEGAFERKHQAGRVAEDLEDLVCRHGNKLGSLTLGPRWQVGRVFVGAVRR